MTDKRTSFQLQKCLVSDENGKRYVEVELTVRGEAEGADQFLIARVEIDSEGHPRLPEAHLEGLQILRNAIGDETSRLSRLRDQVG